MAAARRRVVYVVARNLIVLFVCDFPVGGVDYFPVRLRGARVCCIQQVPVVDLSKGPRRRSRTPSHGVELGTAAQLSYSHPQARCANTLAGRHITS